MFSHASLTVRVSGVQGTATKALLEQRAQDLCSANARIFVFFRRSQPAPLVVSLALQNDSQTGTVTFPLNKSKKRALKNLTGWRGR